MKEFRRKQMASKLFGNGALVQIDFLVRRIQFSDSLFPLIFPPLVLLSQPDPLASVRTCAERM